MLKNEKVKDDVVKIANELIEIGQEIKQLAEEEFFIDFEYRAKQLYLMSQCLRGVRSVTYYGYKSKGGE